MLSRIQSLNLKSANQPYKDSIFMCFQFDISGIFLNFTRFFD